jgi:hypothetical protein
MAPTSARRRSRPVVVLSARPSTCVIKSTRSAVRLLMPLPDHDFDTTEVAVPWKILSELGHAITFATEGGGTAPACDPRLLTGVIFGLLGAKPEPAALYDAMSSSTEFRDQSAGARSTSPRSTGSSWPGDTPLACASTSDRRSSMNRWPDSGRSAGRSVPSATGSWSSPGAWTPRPAGASCSTVGPPVCRRAWNGPPTSPPVGASGPTTGHIRPMSKTRYGRPWPIRPSSLADPIPCDEGRAPTTARPSWSRTATYLSGRWPGDSYLFARRFHSLLTRS